MRWSNESGYAFGSVVVGRQSDSGRSPAFLASPGQIIGAPGANGYARFSTTLNRSYGSTSTENGEKADDEDANIAPSINLDHEILRKDTWSLRAGVSYGFLTSTGDSGYRLDRLDTLLERSDQFGFNYALDNFRYASEPRALAISLSQLQYVVVDPKAYADFVGRTDKALPVVENYIRTLRPLKDFQRTKAEVVAVASFVRSSFDLNSHELSLPLTLRKDVGSRLHVNLTIAPTLTLVDWESKTEVGRRALRAQELAAPQTIILVRNTLPLGVIPIDRDSVPQIPPQVQPRPAMASLPPAPVAPPAGKGSTPQAPDFPGQDVGNAKFTRSSFDTLFGIKTEASLLFDLNDEKTIFTELSGGYHWVQHLHVENGFGEASLDLSGFQVSLGLGFRF